MKILLCRWGLLRFNSILSFYVNWEFITNVLNSEQYVYSIWFFKNLPKMFNQSYVMYLPDPKHEEKSIPREIKSKHEVGLLIKALEKKEEVEIPEDKKQEIIHKMIAKFEV